jgi:hypothetical protein
VASRSSFWHCAEIWVGSFSVIEELLPLALLEKASLLGNEYAWPIADMPEVIEAVRIANLLNIGGQLQFRLKDGGIAECYWIEVDTQKTVPKELTWKERVQLSAESALEQFEKLKATIDFTKEGRDYFTQLVDVDFEQTMCFVWYWSTEAEYMKLTAEIEKFKPRRKWRWL